MSGGPPLAGETPAQGPPNTPPQGGSASDGRPQSDSAGEEPGVFRWVAHPAKERPIAAAAGILVILALSSGVWMMGGGVGWAVFAAIVLCASLSRFFFATHYELEKEGITAWAAAGMRRLQWSEIRRVEVQPRGVWLSTSLSEGWRSRRRGMFALFGRQREEVLAQLRAALPAELLEPPTTGGPGSGSDRTASVA